MTQLTLSQDFLPDLFPRIIHNDFLFSVSWEEKLAGSLEECEFGAAGSIHPRRDRGTEFVGEINPQWQEKRELKLGVVIKKKQNT